MFALVWVPGSGLVELQQGRPCYYAFKITLSRSQQVHTETASAAALICLSVFRDGLFIFEPNETKPTKCAGIYGDFSFRPRFSLTAQGENTIMLGFIHFYPLLISLGGNMLFCPSRKQASLGNGLFVPKWRFSVQCACWWWWMEEGAFYFVSHIKMEIVYPKMYYHKCTINSYI